MLGAPSRIWFSASVCSLLALRAAQLTPAPQTGAGKRFAFTLSALQILPYKTKRTHMEFFLSGAPSRIWFSASVCSLLALRAAQLTPAPQTGAGKRFAFTLSALQILPYKTKRTHMEFFLSGAPSRIWFSASVCSLLALRAAQLTPAPQTGAGKRFAFTLSALQILPYKTKRTPKGVLFAWRAQQDLNLRPTGS